MNTNCNNTKSFCAHKFLAPVKQPPALPVTFSNADDRANRKEKILRRAIIIGTLLILALVAVVFYLKFAALGLSANSPTLEIQSIARY